MTYDMKKYGGGFGLKFGSNFQAQQPQIPPIRPPSFSMNFGQAPGGFMAAGGAQSLAPQVNFDPNQFQSLGADFPGVLGEVHPNLFTAQQVNPMANMQRSLGGDLSQMDGLMGKGFGVKPKTIDAPFDLWDNAEVGIKGLNALNFGILGFKQYGLAKNQLKFEKEKYYADRANNVKLTNAQIKAKHRLFLQERPDLAAPMDEHMAENRVA